MANHSLRAPSIFNLDTNVDIWLARFDNYLELNRIFGDRDKINVLGSFLDDTTFKLVDSLINERSYDEVKTKFRALFSRPESSAHVYLHTFVGRGQELNESLVQYAAVLQELGRKAFPDLNLRELDIYLRGQFLAGVRDREMAERLAVLDHENLEMLVLRAREHEGLPFGISGIRERSRNMFNQGTGRHITEGEIRNLITPKLESNIMFQNQNKHNGNSQNKVETKRNSYDNSFVNANLSNMSNYSNGEKIECLLDTGSVKTLISQNIWRKLGCKELQKTKGSFTTANGQPLNVIGSYTASLRIGTNELKLDVFVAVDLQHDCLIGFDYVGKVQGTRDKLKEIYSSLGGEEVVKDRINKTVNRVEFSQEEQKKMDSFVSESKDIFAKSKKEIGCCNSMDQINTEGKKPTRESARRIPHQLKIEIKEQLDELRKKRFRKGNFKSKEGGINSKRTELFSSIASANYKKLITIHNKFLQIFNIIYKITTFLRNKPCFLTLN
ncbi:Retrovirus-related Pol poly from transposon [Brachionus plicatilis]|uniref:Retrovirus-related Pol poly from transposon n=1 Tax=Brachionus plicatilis TaxID=10195 RepID=A0A3M7T256_BRAPC|nr:Retrovirus-related Pol poly from transposon [Brachionus plicatilis]